MWPISGDRKSGLGLASGEVHVGCPCENESRGQRPSTRIPPDVDLVPALASALKTSIYMAGSNEQYGLEPSTSRGGRYRLPPR